MSTREASAGHVATRRLDEAALRRWPLPSPDDHGDKNTRGSVLVIAGSREMPGAAVLAATAAMRAGAGKLQMATVASVAAHVAMGVPESLVVWLPEDASGRIDVGKALQCLKPLVERADAILIGPGMDEGETTHSLVLELLPLMNQREDKPAVLLDASAMHVLCSSIRRFDQAVMVTPHAGEMARLCGVDKQSIDADPARAASDAARAWNAVVVLKGPTTIIALPDGTAWQHEGGNVGLATSGSGDTLAGIVTGLAARGASLGQACAWGVSLHAMAGEELARRVGPIGYLAREIPDCLPRLLERLAP